MSSKPLAKSLHTVRVLAAIARDIKSREPELDAYGAVLRAMRVLGYDPTSVGVDPYGLAMLAAKQVQ